LLGETETSFADDPFPIEIPGRDTPVSSAKIGEYVTDEFSYYYNIYTHCKYSGPPFSGGWVEWPPWLVSLIEQFDNTTELIRRHNELQAYRQHARQNPQRQS
jgi:hypothetical protein